MEQAVGCCRICHRKLTNPKYVELGVGPVCYKRLQKYDAMPLFTVLCNAKEEQNSGEANNSGSTLPH